jgi:hypothetical protein
LEASFELNALGVGIISRSVALGSAVRGRGVCMRHSGCRPSDSGAADSSEDVRVPVPLPGDVRVPGRKHAPHVAMRIRLRRRRLPRVGARVWYGGGID